MFYSYVSRNVLGGTISAGGFGEAVMPPYGSWAKPWWGPGSKASGSSEDLVL